LKSSLVVIIPLLPSITLDVVVAALLLLLLLELYIIGDDVVDDVGVVVLAVVVVIIITFHFFLSTTSTVSKCSDEDFYWAFNVDEQKKEKMIYNKEELEMMSSFTVSFVF
tara:strand:- start:309 stop:638 length:330 start_codon:yes stop_codon:yes gene_type:complete